MRASDLAKLIVEPDELVVEGDHPSLGLPVDCAVPVQLSEQLTPIAGEEDVPRRFVDSSVAVVVEAVAFHFNEFVIGPVIAGSEASVDTARGCVG